MNPLPITPQTLSIAPRIIWFEPPEQALSNPIRFLAYAMTYARHEDMRVIRQYVSDDDFREALDRAPPGIVDARSWAYWNLMMGRYPAPPLPKRRFGEAHSADNSTGSGGENTRPDSSRDLQTIRQDWRKAWLKMRAQRPHEDLQAVRRHAVANWLDKYKPEKK
jgi:hypothetical protein